MLITGKSCKSGEVRRIKSYSSTSPIKGPFAPPLMLELARLVQHSKLSEEGCKETSVGGHILHPHSLADGVHGEGGHPQVDGPDPDPGRDDRPNGGAAGTVVPHNELLHRGIGTSRKLSEQESSLCIGCIPGQDIFICAGSFSESPLVAVCLDHSALVKERTMVLVMLL